MHKLLAGYVGYKPPVNAEVEQGIDKAAMQAVEQRFNRTLPQHLLAALDAARRPPDEAA